MTEPTPEFMSLGEFLASNQAHRDLIAEAQKQHSLQSPRCHGVMEPPAPVRPFSTCAVCGFEDYTEWPLPQDHTAALEHANARIANLEDRIALLSAGLAEYNSIALEATGTVPDMERGDGTTGYVDWQGVWEQVAELRPHLDAANKRIAALEAPATTDRLAQFLLQVTPATRENCRAMAERALDLLREVSDRV